MKMFEPENEIPWIGLTLDEERKLATSVLGYMGESQIPANDCPILMGRIDTGVIKAEDFVSYYEACKETITGIPDIEWDDECEENNRGNGKGDTKLIAERLWIWKDVWETWTKDHLPEFPGNETLHRIDSVKFFNSELEKATSMEMRFWELFTQNAENMKNATEAMLFEMTLDQSPRGEDVIASCLLKDWKEMENDIIAEINV